jgi:GNAT superfamily N-acetyltransferase
MMTEEAASVGAPAHDGIRFTERPDEPGEVPGRTKAELFVDGTCVSWLTVVPFTIRVGRATLRMDGIGGVGTHRAHRHKGYSRRVIEATIGRMARLGAAVSMLYGIPDFYPKFGYATAGAEHTLYLRSLWSKRATTSLPTGWSVRPFARDDLLAIQRLYELNTTPPFAPHTVGAAVRPLESPTWHGLITSIGEAAAGRQDGCRVVLDINGQVRAYAWRDLRFWFSHMLSEDFSDAFVLAEAMADSPAAADAVLIVCRLWARERSEGHGDPFRHVLIPHPPEGPLAAAVARTDGRIEAQTAQNGQSMVRLLDPDRLITALAPELRARLSESRTLPPASLHFITEIGESTLHLEGQDTLTAHLPHQALAQLALGAHEPADLLDRLPTPPDARARDVLIALFPKRHQYMYAPDRY